MLLLFETGQRPRDEAHELAAICPGCAQGAKIEVRRIVERASRADPGSRSRGLRGVAGSRGRP
ncbi:MAG: hypothetical protein WBP81_39115, partial [Solirubrobacteraceae bacterium]